MVYPIFRKTREFLRLLPKYTAPKYRGKIYLIGDLSYQNPYADIYLCVTLSLEVAFASAKDITRLTFLKDINHRDPRDKMNFWADNVVDSYKTESVDIKDLLKTLDTETIYGFYERNNGESHSDYDTVLVQIFKNPAKFLTGHPIYQNRADFVKNIISKNPYYKKY